MSKKRICKYKDCTIELRDGEKKYCPEHTLRKKSFWNKTKAIATGVGGVILVIIFWPFGGGGDGEA